MPLTDGSCSEFVNTLPCVKPHETAGDALRFHGNPVEGTITDVLR